MSPEKRLDQLEPVIGEMAAQLDLHTAQLRRVTTGITTIMEIVSRQSDDIIFLLKGQAQMKTDIAEMKTGIAETKIEIYEIRTDITQINNKLDGVEQMVTAILNAVQKPTGN